MRLDTEMALADAVVHTTHTANNDGRTTWSGWTNEIQQINSNWTTASANAISVSSRIYNGGDTAGGETGTYPASSIAARGSGLLVLRGDTGYADYHKPVLRCTGTNVTVPNNTLTNIKGGSIYVDSGISHSNGTFTVEENGIYAASIAGNWSATISGTTRNFIEIQYTTSMSRYFRQGAAPSESYIGVTGMSGLTVGDTIKFNAFQSTGSNKTFSNMNIHIAKVAELY